MAEVSLLERAPQPTAVVRSTIAVSWRFRVWAHDEHGHGLSLKGLRKAAEHSIPSSRNVLAHDHEHVSVHLGCDSRDAFVNFLAKAF